jgi:hypothetical protein
MGEWVHVSGYKVDNKFPIGSQFVSKPDRAPGKREQILCQYSTEDREI